ncbi:hypothetical protein IRZ59_08295 [Pseudomonas guariconensis]|uniref:phage tail assembly chaperone n=1 Tax=Pseudomonas guariconensis TaxID=1288410 RepID=UPI0018AB91FC|nr:phage tail assembly chaperone [Pseudomonas guariconensis]MBF8730447.1 hypothetical protein [Pseudomonas guariconensis]
MPYVQRDAGGLVVGEFANLQPGFAEEWLPHDAPELLPAAAEQAVAERAWRDAELAGLVWLRDRHRDQVEIGVPTTLTPDQFAELLVFMQALRDWPQSEAFPDSAQRPVAPPWIAEQAQ